MRVLVVSRCHPLDPRVWDDFVRPLRDAGDDVLYVAPFAETGVAPPAGLVGLDLPSRGRAARRAAAGVLRHRGPDVDVVVVAAGERGQTIGGRPRAVIRSTVRQRIGRRSPASSRQPSAKPDSQPRSEDTSCTRATVTKAHVPR